MEFGDNCPEDLDAVEVKMKNRNQSNSCLCGCPSGVKEMLKHVLDHRMFQILVVVLSALDGILLISVLCLEIERLQTHDQRKIILFDNVKFCIECSSLIIIMLFVVEIPFKLWILGYKLYLHSIMETIDAIICLVSLGLDVYVIHKHINESRHHVADSLGTAEHALVVTTMPNSTVNTDAKTSMAEAAGFLVLFRLWRVIRIVNSVLVINNEVHEIEIHKLIIECNKLMGKVFILEELYVANGHSLPDYSFISNYEIASKSDAVLQTII